jgi:RNA polymerase sigma factor (sigma-70 family)
MSFTTQEFSYDHQRDPLTEQRAIVSNDDTLIHTSKRLADVMSLAESKKSRQNKESKAINKSSYITELYKNHVSTLRKYLTRFSLCKSDSEDIIQEVFIRLLKQDDITKIEQNPAGYLVRTAKNLVLDEFKRVGNRYRNLHDPIEEHDISCNSPQPETATAWQQGLEIIEKRLCDDGKRTHQIVAMSCLVGLTHLEIADKIGVTTRTVERSMQRARNICLTVVDDLPTSVNFT